MGYDVGKKYLVACLTRKVYRENIDEQNVWMDIYPVKNFTIEYVPVINYLHNDIENGQKEYHYHYDPRWIEHGIYIPTNDFRPLKINYDKLEWLELECKESIIERRYITPIELIKNSKLKHKCIHKGKCPHRGYDLSNEKDIDGVITCPLHGLKFNKSNKMLIIDV
jgi:hypothetical protein